jgi:mono/diheme cytochrome c family protein
MFLGCAFALPALAQEKTTYQDHVRPIFNTSCVSCHNPDKNKAGLDLTSYSATMKGSSNGKILDLGDPIRA